MLTQADNDMLTRVGPGTPAGELLRRYWYPVAMPGEISEEKPTRLVRLLGERFVLFRDTHGRVGLLAERCPHRGASLCYGRVEERGISCAYHGWLMDTAGTILETPPERNDAIVNGLRQPAFPVRQQAGMYWTYIGPDPVPELPHLDTLVRTDGRRSIQVHPSLDCNWFQIMENSVDPAHLQILHQEFIGRGVRTPASTTRGFIDDVVETDFQQTEIGIMKKRTYRAGGKDEHPLVFPNTLRQGPSTQIRVPLDDTHTAQIFVMFEAGEEADPAEEPTVQYVAAYKNPPDAVYPEAIYDMRTIPAQDAMAWETQGRIADRTTEHLSYSDRGVALLRKLLIEQIERVQAGRDPMGVYRDPRHPLIDTNVDESTRVEGARVHSYTQTRPTDDTLAITASRP